MDRFFQILSDGVHRFEGTVNQFTRRRHHGALRRPDRARGPRAARLLRGAASEGRAPALRRASSSASADSASAVRMGLNSGEVVVGKIGDDLRMDYTAHGHTVGLAARMEQLADAGTRST